MSCIFKGTPVTTKFMHHPDITIMKGRWPFGREYPEVKKVKIAYEDEIGTNYKTGELEKQRNLRMTGGDDQEDAQHVADEEFAQLLTNIFKITMGVLAISALIATGALLNAKFHWIR